jgi:hypothetical protein
MTHPRTNLFAVLLFVCMLGVSGCSDSKPDSTAAAIPEFEPDTSYLDQLAKDEGIETTEAPTTEPEQPPEIATAAPAEKEYTDEEREWTKEEGSKSIFGRSRDKAKNLRDRIQDSTAPENGIANTSFDEEYAQAAGFAWDMPDGWRMAVPAGGRFAEMYIKNPLGNASVAFSKQTGSITQIKRSLESKISDTYGDRTISRPTTKVVKGFTVTVFDIAGSYIDPSSKGSRNESPFYAIHAVVIELPTSKVLIELWGPQETVNRSKYAFDTMVEKMYEK